MSSKSWWLISRRVAKADTDCRLFKLLLDDLGVTTVAACIGGSMGGALVLEFAYFGKDYVRCIVPIATSARYSAWCISWGEAQRQSIYSDPKYGMLRLLFDLTGEALIIYSRGWLLPI
jgi:homoserine acetyltransferase